MKNPPAPPKKIRPTMKVRPLKKIIRDPKTFKILPHNEDTVVPMNSYWTRRVRCGDCEQIGVRTEKAATEKPEPKQAKKD